MAYNKTVWTNDTAPAINADNLNKIEQGIYDNDQEIDSVSNYVKNTSYQWQIGYRIATGSSPVDINAVYPSPAYSCVIVPVKKGQRFKLTAHSSNSIYNAYCFTDTNYVNKKISGAGSFNNYDLTAEQDGYLICCTDDNNYHVLTGVDVVPSLMVDNANLKARTSVLEWTVKNIESITFPESFYERGQFGASGSEAASDYRIRTKYKIKTTRDVTIIPKSGYLVQVVVYTSDGIYETQSAFQSTPYTVTAGKQFRISISNAVVTTVVAFNEKNNVVFVNASYDEYIAKKELSESEDYTLQVKENILKYNAAIFGTESNSNGTIYHVGAAQEYQTIASALAQWAEDNYPVATVFIDNGVYKESNTVEGKTIQFIGESRDGTIIHTTSGNYTDPAFNIRHGNVKLKNMTLIADHSENPDFDYETGQGLKAYGVHIDGGNIGGIVTLENCTIMSFQAPAVGTGTIPDSKIRLIDCDCYCFTDYTSDTSTAQAYQLNLGCILWHTSSPEVYPTRGDESFELVNVRAYMENNYVVFRTTQADVSDTMDTLAINTLLVTNRNPYNQNPVSGPVHPVEGSIGNSDSVLNYS